MDDSSIESSMVQSGGDPTAVGSELGSEKTYPLNDAGGAGVNGGAESGHAGAGHGPGADDIVQPNSYARDHEKKPGNEDLEAGRDESEIEQAPPGLAPSSSSSSVSAPPKGAGAGGAAAPVGPPPNGGLVAWLQVLGGFLAFFNSWGIVNGFGEYQAYYQQALLAHESPSTISWIGSIQGFFVVSGTIVTGRLLDAGHLRPILIAGTFLMTFGMMMTSLATEFYQVFLSQGVCVGLGSSCLFVSALTTVSPYFSTRRSLAIGIMASGSSFGGVLYPIMVHRLIPELGFPWATRVIGFIILGTGLVPTVLLKSRLPPRKSGPFIDWASFKDVPYMLFLLACFLGFIGLYVPIFYIDSFAEFVNIEPSLRPYMVSILSVGSIFGRLVPNFLADRTGPFNMLFPCTLCAGILCFCWIGVSGIGGTIVFAWLYGFFSGAYVSLPPSCIVRMTPDLTKLGSRLSMNFLAAGVGILMGTPVAGALIVRQDGKFLGAQLWAGCVVILAVCAIAFSRLSHTNYKLYAKA